MNRLNIATHPELATLSRPRAPLTWTRHAMERTGTKGVTHSTSIVIAAGDVVEAEVSYGKVTKLVVRQSQCPQWDRVLVLVPRDGGFTVVTCWLNHKSDTHKTLNRTRLSA